MLEEEAATAARLWQALLDAGDAAVDLLLLVHGQVGYACGHGDDPVGADFFAGLRQPARGWAWPPFSLRAVYQMNCYGAVAGPRVALSSARGPSTARWASTGCRSPA
jgi:hypothetical protein